MHIKDYELTAQIMKIFRSCSTSILFSYAYVYHTNSKISENAILIFMMYSLILHCLITLSDTLCYYSFCTIVYNKN